MIRSPGRALAAAAALVTFVAVGLSCRDAAHASGTALLIRVNLGGLAPDQLRYLGTDTDGAATVFGPALEPSSPGTVPDLSTVRVLLKDALADHVLDVAVDGLKAGEVLGSDVERVRVVKGVETVVDLRLQAPMTMNDGGCTTCVTVSGTCVGTPSAGACGTGGNSCVACDVNASNTCGADGLCHCGSGPPCSALTGGTCVNGTCQCGAGPSCGPGLECLAGICQCTPNSCAGCCSGGACVVNGDNNPAACGTGGHACLDCGATACSGGACGMATCNATNCAGCCSGSTCLPGDAGANCGTAGMACVTCGAGTCTAGACTGGCGPATCDGGCCAGGVCQPGDTTAACGTGGGACQMCTLGCDGGACLAQCSAANPCASGCCSNGQCQPGTANNACGSSGGTCIGCTAGSQCDAGACSGGCSATSCAQGCCDGLGQCQPRDIATCGAAGTACLACDPVLADTCSSMGRCVCGTGNSACPPGDVCDGGACSCDPARCGGCCPAGGGHCQTGNSKSACGLGGVTCVNCGTGNVKCDAGVCS